MTDNNPISEPDISVIITAHQEGLLAGISGRSAQAAVKEANRCGLSCELIIVLDRADSLTSEVLSELFNSTATIIRSDEGDPGQARNRGVEIARGTCTTFLDGDDLWSENWLVQAWNLSRKRPEAAFHSACNLVFGQRRMLFWHIDSESALCDPTYLDWMNYWDAMSFGRTHIYRQFPFKRNDLSLGFGHEDWHWNAWTLANGIPHKPVPGTMHFKRSRRGSQMSRVDSVDGIRWPMEYEELLSLRS